MKKIYYLALALTISFASCEKEDVSEIEDSSLEAVNHSYRYKKKRKCTSNCRLDVLENLPSTANACITGQGSTSATGAYWDIEISDTSLAGTYPGWCIDEDLGFDNSCFEIVSILSSYSDLSGYPFEVTENFDSMNWLLNSDLLESILDGSSSSYTFGDFQAAIWILVEGESCNSCNGLGDWDQDRAMELVDLALSEGEGYEPESGENIGVILVPENDQQSLIVPYKYECKEECKRKCYRRCKGRWYKHHGKYKKCGHYYKKRKWKWWSRW
ncbi:hypothetical protein [Flagellimonas sp. S3867]|uniref:hypothetical protein n=1 Tax=Flagellimonas sp. S3867 TaxID=2768063 RepID=UPI0016877897|nr:hypothetical protein [Flagellimonas sp. S3867]